MVFRPLVGALIAVLFAPPAARVRSASPAPAATGAAPALSRRPAAEDPDGGEFVHAISHGRRDSPVGIVQA